MPPSENKGIPLELTGISHGGDAIGKLDGMVVFVPYGIPGEIVSIEITEKKSRFARGSVVDVLVQSSERVEPPCQYFERCGGCHWQHITYSAQLRLKKQIVEETLSRIGGFANPEIHPTIPNANPWRYRSHLTFHVDHAGQLGLISTDKKNIISIDDCHIAHPEIIDLLHKLDSTMTYRDRLDQYVRIQVGADHHPYAFNLPETDSFQSIDVPPTVYTVLGHSFNCSPGSFFQADPEQAEKLVEIVLDRLTLSGAEQVLDLFSGVGLFTAFIAQQAARVISVEISPVAVQDAKVNLAPYKNVTLIRGGIRESLGSNAIPPSLSIDSIVVDPPRTGIKTEDLEAIVTKSPHNIVYVSCDPATLARDAKFLAGNGYTLVDVQPIDMFPQTYHIEAVTTFIRA